MNHFLLTFGSFRKTDSQGTDTGDRMQAPYYWSQGMSANVPTTTSMSYTMGSQQAYDWRDTPQMDPTGGYQQQQPQHQGAYWSQDPNQADPGATQHRHHGSSHRSSGRRDGGSHRR